MQILHQLCWLDPALFGRVSDPDRYRPDHCPQCEAHCPLRAHGFYTRTLVDVAFDGTIRVRRYLCCCCKRTVSLLPEFSLPYLRFGIVPIALFLVARLLLGLTLKAAAESATLAAMPYQRGQLWVHRFRQQAEKLCAALAALTAAPGAPDFTARVDSNDMREKRFSIQRRLLPGHIIRFIVFSGPEGIDGTFDATSLKALIEW